MLTKVVTFFAGNLVTKLIVETFLALIARIAWAEVIERLMMRLIKFALRNLAARTTNTVDDRIVEAIISQLEKNSLPRV